MRLAASSASRDETCSGGVRYRNCLYGCRPWPAHESRHEGPPRVASQRTRDSPPPTPEMPTRHAWVSAWQGRRRRARATRALSQSVEVGDIRVVPDAPRNRLGSATAHQRDDIEGRSDVRKQPAPPGPESGEGAARSAGMPRVIEHESARIRWPHGSTWPVGRQGSSESARASRFFAPRSGRHRLVLGAAG